MVDYLRSKYHIDKIKTLQIFLTHSTYTKRNTIFCCLYKCNTMYSITQMTIYVKLSHKVQVDKRIKGVVLSRLTLEQSPHSILTKHPHWTKQRVTKQTTHTGLAVCTYKRGIHGVND